MATQPISRSFRFLTPAFAHGAYQAQQNNIPELRAPSIRGHLRWWWRALGYGSGDDLFGSASGNTGTASRIQTRLIVPAKVGMCEAEILPHKDNFRQRGPKTAIHAITGNVFTLELRAVRAGISPGQSKQLKDCLAAWLLMGAVGQRANRTAGSIWPTDTAPDSPADYLRECRSLLAASTVKIALLDTPLRNFDEVRNLSGRFLGGFKVEVPGNVFGSAVPRKSSSLKLRAVLLEDSLRIAALWCPKDDGDTSRNLQAALSQMKRIEAKAELARLLEDCLPSLIP